MKELGNLAILCANRNDVLMQIYEGTVSVHIGEGPDRTYMLAAWDDDRKLKGIIHELNHGRYVKKHTGNTPKQVA